MNKVQYKISDVLSRILLENELNFPVKLYDDSFDFIKQKEMSGRFEQSVIILHGDLRWIEKSINHVSKYLPFL